MSALGRMLLTGFADLARRMDAFVAGTLLPAIVASAFAKANGTKRGEKGEEGEKKDIFLFGGRIRRRRPRQIKLAFIVRREAADQKDSHCMQN